MHVRAEQIPFTFSKAEKRAKKELPALALQRKKRRSVCTSQEDSNIRIVVRPSLNSINKFEQVRAEQIPFTFSKAKKRARKELPSFLLWLYNVKKRRSVCTRQEDSRSRMVVRHNLWPAFHFTPSQFLESTKVTRVKKVCPMIENI